MLELATVFVYPFCTFLGLCSILLALAKFSWWQNRRQSNLELYYQRGSEFAEGVIRKCRTLQEGYKPVPPWGWSGQLQTIMFGSLGRTGVTKVPGQRHCLKADDGSNVYYDVFEPNISEEERKAREKESGTASPITFFAVPGINNSSEKSYMQVFARYCTNSGYRVIILNHLGALDEELAAHRIFTYGGTGDLALVYEDVCKRFPDDRLVGCGFSLGACILVRFLGECKDRQSRFLCAVSMCQGYDPYTHMDAMSSWQRLHRLYSRMISRGHRKLIKRHSSKLFQTNIRDKSTTNSTSIQNGHTPLPNHLWNGFRTSIIHDGYNSNGCSLDPTRCEAPDMDQLMAATSMLELDEAYTRRILGFPSVRDMYRWISCVDLMNQISDLPLLLVNAWDDPCIVLDAYQIPKEYASKHSKSLFVLSRYGGHLGFFEGSFIKPRSETWMDRAVVEFAQACLAS